MESRELKTNEALQEGQKENEEKNFGNISLWVLRHGEWDFKNDQLTEKGKVQAREAADNLLKNINPGERIKFYSSPAERTMETANIMIEEIKKKNQDEGLNIDLMADVPRKRENLKQVKFDDEFDKLIEKAGYDKKDILEFWYNMPEIEGIEKPEEVQKRFRDYVEKISKMVSRLKQGRSKTNIIFISHGEVPTPILNEMFGVKGLSPAGWVKLDFRADELNKVRYSRATKTGQIESRVGPLK